MKHGSGTHGTTLRILYETRGTNWSSNLQIISQQLQVAMQAVIQTSCRLVAPEPPEDPLLGTSPGMQPVCEPCPFVLPWSGNFHSRIHRPCTCQPLLCWDTRKWKPLRCCTVSAMTWLASTSSHVPIRPVSTSSHR